MWLSILLISDRGQLIKSYKFRIYRIKFIVGLYYRSIIFFNNMYICEINNIENEKKKVISDSFTLFFSLFLSVFQQNMRERESHLYLFGLNKNNLTFKTKQHNKKNSFYNQKRYLCKRVLKRRRRGKVNLYRIDPPWINTNIIYYLI